MDDRGYRFGQWLAEVIVWLVVFVFKIVFYWPITFLYQQYETRQSAVYKKEFEAKQQQREATRRSRNTLYDGPQQPNT